MIDATTRARILTGMRDAGGASAEIADLIAIGLDPYGQWNSERLKGHLEALDDRTVLNNSQELLCLVDEEDTVDLNLIDAALEAYATRTAAPLEVWLAAYAEVLER